MPADALGFADVIPDGGKIIHRQLLSATPSPTSPCPTDYSLSLLLAANYLAEKGHNLELTPKQYWKLGSVVFKPLEPHSGGYQKFDAAGYQVLLNYRSFLKVAPQVTVTDVLTGQFNPEDIKDRIVLFGYDESNSDQHLTPYSAGQESNAYMAGVVLQAQMVSHILSTVLDKRPLLWVWSGWGDALWVWGWAIAGGMLVWYVRSPLHLGLAAGVALVVLGGICFIFLLRQGGWVPLIPSAIALVTTGGSLVCYTAVQVRRQK
jgi:CHASE2 domain-containing sensor protein